ncbi:hypothetical protein [Streptomyces sp. NPDC060194]|uniref:hypothetical protein n=1 Tax=Streptomyces sp. NPDC060194 TaxID=3347069 RepID=UPI003647AC27
MAVDLTHRPQRPTTTQPEPGPGFVFVYRAAYLSIPLGTYTTQAAARAHCEADALNQRPDWKAGSFDWLGDPSEPDDPYELTITRGGDEDVTGHTVTRITVATAYDPKADA